MPRKIIVLDRVEANGQFYVRAAFWLPPPSNPRPRAAAAAAPSAVSNATPGELQQIQSGLVIERVIETGLFDVSTPDATVQTELVERYAAAEALLADELKGGVLIGANWDGNAWASTGGRL